MADRISTEELRRLARAGAEARLTSLEAERASLLRIFPDLRRGRTISTSGRAGGTETNRARRRGSMSAAARKAVSLRMKKYWAARRAASKTSAR